MLQFAPASYVNIHFGRSARAYGWFFAGVNHAVKLEDILFDIFFSVLSKSRLFACLIITAVLIALAVQAQVSKEETKAQPTNKVEEEKKSGGKSDPVKPEEKAKAPAVPLTLGERIAEGSIYFYGGRVAMKTARAGFQEDGAIRLATDQGDITGTFKSRSMRKDKSWEDLLRTDLELNTPEAAQRAGAPAVIKYTIAFNGGSVWSAQNNQYTNTKPEAEASFRAILTHDYSTLLRYKEDGSKLEQAGTEKIAGIENQIIDMTTPGGEKTRYWISAKSYRIQHLEYELKQGDGPPIKFRVSFYYAPPRVYSNTLVPTRRVMTQDGKFVQEIVINSVTPAAKLDQEIFQHLQE